MYIEVVVVITFLAALIGVLLYLPVYLVAKRKLRPPRRESWFTIRITRAGAVFYGLMVTILFFGFAQGLWAPDTIFGRYMGSGVWRLLFAITLIVVWILLEVVLRKRGFEFYRRVDRNVQQALAADARRASRG